MTAYDRRIDDWSSDVGSSDLDPLGHPKPFLQRLVALDQVMAQIGQEQRAGDRLEGVTVEIAAQPLVEALTAHSPIDGAQESRALVVGDRAHPFVGIPIGEIEMEPGRRRIDARLPDRGFQLLPAELDRSEEHTSELQSLMRNSYAVLCLKKKT